MSRLRVLLSIVLLAAGAAGQSLTAAQKSSMDRALSYYLRENKVPGASLAVALDGQVVYANAYGLADVENSVPVRPETVFRSASIAKSMTATAAMQLVERRLLDLDQPIQTYCPAFPAKSWPITSRQLLTHTSGIRHYGGPHAREELTSTAHYADVADALAPFKDDPLLFEPGTRYSYSSFGYDVLGCVLQGAAHRPFLEIVRTGIFEPAGMQGSRDDDPAALIPNRAAGYRLVDGRLQNAPHVDLSNRLPAGGYLNTATDLARFAIAFLDCKLVACSSRDAMLTEARLKNGDRVSYGFGWEVLEDAGRHPTGEYLHVGSSQGASGVLYIVPSRRLAVALLTNLEDVPQRLEIARAIAGIALQDRH
ncbi:MAG TPA: serine hydrolase domain-containing protein [Terriglobales bacterium]|nr:serine hydrolase domain-containing protein [Terriglobales bacterium]